MPIAPQIGPKPTAWTSIELGGHLLTGELVGGKWQWEVDWSCGVFEGELIEVITRFTKFAMRNPVR